MYLWPRDFTFGNYIYFLKDPKWINAFGISVIRTVVGTALGVLFTGMVAYGLSKRDLMFQEKLFLNRRRSHEFLRRIDLLLYRVKKPWD